MRLGWNHGSNITRSLGDVRWSFRLWMVPSPYMALFFNSGVYWHYAEGWPWDFMARLGLQPEFDLMRPFMFPGISVPSAPASDL